jgi:transcriptional regulator with XRE-family HTH domain
VESVDAATELSEFLTSRRAKITPAQAGLPTYGQRRVPGLRREEVASLAGVSVEYYRRLERGNATGASDAVLEALADALGLDDAERAHLFDLARAAGPIAPRRRRVGGSSSQRVRPVLQRILDSITAPAAVRNMRSDYLAANELGRALYAPLFESPEQPPNSARFTFLDPAAQEFFLDCTAFRTWWAAHNVRYHQTGSKRLRHPVVGELELSYEVMELAADNGLRLAIFTAEPGSRSEQALDLLASWTATPQRPLSLDGSAHRGRRERGGNHYQRER